MNPRRDPDRLIHAFLLEGAEQLDDQVYDAVRGEIDKKRQRVVIGPWRIPALNKLVPVGLGAAALIVAVVIGARFLGPPASGGVGGAPSASPSPTPEPTPAPSASPIAWTGLPRGPFVITSADDPVAVTVDIESPAWTLLPEYDLLSKDDDGLDAPESVGAALLAWSWPAGTGYTVYGDACEWSTTIPATPATTPEDIAAGLVAQASNEATTPVDVTVGGYSGKALTLRTPMAFFVDADATREEEFAACDQTIFGFYGIEGEPEPARNAQGPGQVDELWILDVNGAIVILDATYGPATPAALIDEVRAMAESATFELP